MIPQLTRTAGLVCLLAALLVAGAAGAQELRNTLFERADRALAAADEAKASTLSPRNYERGREAYEDAERDLERGRNIEGIRRKLAEATKYFRDAAEAAELASLTLAPVIKTRQDALAADAPTLSGPIWEDAERKFADAVRYLERGDLGDSRKRAAEAESLYRDAELGAIKTRYLSDTRRLLAEADRARVDRYAPRTLAKAQELLKQAERELNENRYDTDLPRSLAQQANYEARHAIYLTELVRRVRDRDLSVEELVLEWEAPLIAIAGAADVVPDLSEGNDALTAVLVEYIDDLRAEKQSLEQDLMEANARVIEMEEELRILDEKLGGATAERQALMRSLQAQQRVREQFEQVEQMFSRDEAQVFREGNEVILRLVGLSFPSGRATVDSEYYPLLTKVEKAIDVFPRSDLRVEGHTDSYGGDEANMRLSQARAEAVMNYMINAMRIPSNRIAAVGHGETRPIANNETAEGRARNRRIDIVIQPKLD